MGRQRGLYKSAASREAVLAAGDRLLGKVVVPFERREIPTSMGATFVVDAGAHDAPPLLILHAMGLCAGAYHPEINMLAQWFRVLVPDLPGQPGRSFEDGLPAHGPAWGQWQSELLDGLGVSDVVVVGHSLGGYVGLKLAERAPARVRGLALIVPAGLSAPSVVRMAPLLLRAAWARIRRSDGWMERAFGAHAGASAELVGFLELAAKHTRVAVRPYPVMSVEQLVRYPAPALVMPAEHDAIYDPARTADGARRVLRQVTVEPLLGHGHLYDDARRRAVAKRIGDFFRHLPSAR